MVSCQICCSFKFCDSFDGSAQVYAAVKVADACLVEETAENQCSCS